MPVGGAVFTEGHGKEKTLNLFWCPVIIVRFEWNTNTVFPMNNTKKLFLHFINQISKFVYFLKHVYKTPLMGVLSKLWQHNTASNDGRSPVDAVTIALRCVWMPLRSGNLERLIIKRWTVWLCFKYSNIMQLLLP